MKADRESGDDRDRRRDRRPRAPAEGAKKARSGAECARQAVILAAEAESGSPGFCAPRRDTRRTYCVRGQAKAIEKTFAALKPAGPPRRCWPTSTCRR